MTLDEKRLALLERLASTETPAPAVAALRRRPDDAEPVASFAQERLWLLDQLGLAGGAYNIPAAFRIRGPLRVASLAAAVALVVGRHETLRTAFHEAGGRPELRILEPADPDAVPPLPVVDLSALPAPRRREEHRRRLRQHARRPFDLARPPLLRVAVLRRDERDHTLLLALHHVAGDGWSSAVLVREMLHGYAAHAAGEAPSLEPLPIRYRDFAAWQRQRMRGEMLEEALAYWRRRLAGLPSHTALPADRPRPAVAGLGGGRVPLEIPARTGAALRRLGREHRATDFVVLLAAFQALLHRVSGQRSVAVGVPVAGRSRPQTEGLVGLFVNTVVHRSDRSGDPSFADFLDAVRPGVVEDQAHAELPFERLVEELSPGRDLSRSPLFQVMFAFQNQPRRDPAVDGLDLRRLAVDTGGEKFDLTLTLEADGDRFSGDLSYAVDLFDRTTAERLASHLVRLLESAAAAPERRLSDLELLGAGERVQVTREWSRGLDADRAAAGRPGAGAPSLGAWLGECAAAWPEAVAVEWGALRLSYGELLRRADAVAAALRSRGVGPESRVAVSAGRGAALYVALAGVWRAGAAHVPLDPGYPDDRRRFMLEDSGAEVVLAAGETEELPVPVVSLGEAMAAGAEESRPLPAAGPDHLAYVIYTSGSTGRPKGVAIRHGSALELAAWAARAYGRETLAGVLAATSVGFDLSVFELLAAWGAGGRLVVARDAVALAEMPEAWGVTLVNTVPSAAAELTAAGAVPGSVREMNLAGEPLRRALVEAVHAAGVGAVRNLYGPSEDTTYSTGLVVPAGVAEEPTIGRPLAGSRGYVVDGEGRPVPVGVVGELWLGGPGLARGYLGRPARTAESFVPDGLTSDTSSGDAAPGARLYRTGDLARWRRDGELEFLGRRDHQVKVRGYRIELGEVEVAVESHPAVAEAVVMVAGETLAERRLVAYVVCAAGAGEELDGAELRSWLQERVPAYVVPSVFSVLEDFPRTPSGKVDRRSLPAPETGPRQVVAPANELERELAALWAEVLGVGEVGAEDDFFALGGHSLAAVRVASRVRETQGVDLSLRVVFEAPTVRALAARVEARRDADTTAAGLTAPLERADRSRPLPLSWAQERLWFLQRLEPESAAYHLAGALRLRGPVDVAALTSALSAVAARHETLRTAFREVEGVPVQVPLPPAPVPLPRIDLSALPEANGAADLRGAALDGLLARIPVLDFPLSAGRLLRAVLVRVTPREVVLVLVVHHLVADGWSLSVLVRDLVEAYRAVREGRPPRLPELPVQYADYAAWQRRPEAAARMARQVAYWRSRLDGLAPAELPRDRPRARRRSHGGRHVEVLPPARVDALRRLAQRRGASLFMGLLAALFLLLQRWTGVPRVAVGAPVAGRPRPELEELVGCFLNTVVLDARPDGGDGFAALLDRVRKLALAAYEHGEVPFERLLAELQPDRDLSRTPLFQVFVNMLNVPQPDLRLPGAEVESLELPEVRPKLDLTLYLEETGTGGLRSTWVYDAGLFSAERIAAMAAQLARVVERAVADPHRPVRELSLVAPEELPPDPVRSQGPWPGPVHRRFAALAAERPERVAVADGRGAWTYGALRRAVAALAARLRREGVQRGDVVAVWAHRSPSLVWALLGVLEAGGAFLVLDPAQPPRRLAAMLERARLRVLVLLQEAGPLPEALAEPAAPTVLLPSWHRAGGWPAAEAAADPAPVAGFDSDPHDLAYLAFTSGSTGEPKGILGRHGPLTAFTPWQCRRFGLGPEDRYSLLSGIGHDPLQRDVFTPLATGGAVVVPAADDLARAGALAAWLQRTGVTVAHLTPALLQLVTQPPAGEPDLEVTALRRAFVVGAALPLADVERLRRRAPGVRCVNLYGSTETQRAVGFHPLEPAEPSADGVAPLGRGMEGAQLLLLGPGAAPAAVGELGEIHLRSPHLAAGYLEMPARTAERFVPDPWGDGGRMYRTGDLGRHGADGTVHFAGRADQQVQVRGYRVEPTEVEAVLAALPGIDQGAVLARPAGVGDHELVAFYAGRDAPGPDALRRRLREALPDAMVPSRLHRLEDLPLTPNGKVDRRALAELGGDPEAGSAERREEGGQRPLATATEQLLGSLWKELLEVPAVGPEDDFFVLGGHSLLLMRMLARVRDLTGVDLPVSAVFEAPRLAEVAATVEARRLVPPETSLPPLEPRPNGGPAPLSAAQRRLWFHAQLDPGGSAWNLLRPLRLRGPLVPAALDAALAEAVARHEALRTTFSTAGGRPVQRVEEARPVPFPRVDLSRLHPGHRDEEARLLVAEEAARSFDLERGPVFRARLLRRERDDHVACLALHHLVGDGWSFELLLGELLASYRTARRGEPSGLPEREVQYADYAAWQQRWLDGERTARELDHWLRELGDAPPVLDLAPPGRQRREAPPAGRARRRLPMKLSESLKLFNRSQGTTLFALSVSAWLLVLAARTGRSDLVLGLDVTERVHSRTQRIVGLFVNQAVLRIDLSDDPNFLNLSSKVKEKITGAFHNSHIPFDKVVEALRPPRRLGTAPVFQVKLNLRQGLGLVGSVPGELAVEPVELPDRQAQLDLVLNLAERSDGAVDLDLEYRRDLFEPSDAEELLEEAEAALETVRRPQQPMSRVVERLARLRREREAGEARRFGASAGRSLRRRLGSRTSPAATTPSNDAGLAGEDA